MLLYLYSTLSSQREKCSFWRVCPVKTRITLRTQAVWSESSLEILWIAKTLKFLQMVSEASGILIRLRDVQGDLSLCLTAHSQRNISHVVAHITKTCLCNFDPLKPHFYIVKVGFTGVYTIFFISAQNIDCGYSLEPPRRGGSNEYPQSMFWAEIWKISVLFYLNLFIFWW